MKHPEPCLPDQVEDIADAIPLPADLPASFKSVATGARFLISCPLPGPSEG